MAEYDCVKSMAAVPESKVAPAPGLTAPAVAIVQFVPPDGLQSFRVKVAAELAGCAAIFSKTVCASMVEVVSPLERPLFMTAVMNRPTSALIPTASTEIAIISSMSENPQERWLRHLE